jgi:hypothetical protein
VQSFLQDFSTPPRVTDLATPKPGPGEVLVRVKASSINGFDAAVVAGWLEGMLEHRFPIVMARTSPALSRRPATARPASPPVTRSSA